MKFHDISLWNFILWNDEISWNFMKFHTVFRGCVCNPQQIPKNSTRNFEIRLMIFPPKNFKIEFWLFLCVSRPTKSITEVSKNFMKFHEVSWNFMKFHCEISIYKVSWNFASLLTTLRNQWAWLSDHYFNEVPPFTKTFRIVICLIFSPMLTCLGKQQVA